MADGTQQTVPKLTLPPMLTSMDSGGLSLARAASLLRLNSVCGKKQIMSWGVLVQSGTVSVDRSRLCMSWGVLVQSGTVSMDRSRL